MKLGQLYYVKFYDHSTGGDREKLLACECVGWLVEENKINMVLAYWQTYDSDSKTGLDKDNEEVTSIVKSTIIYKKQIPDPRKK